MDYDVKQKTENARKSTGNAHDLLVGNLLESDIADRSPSAQQSLLVPRPGGITCPRHRALLGLWEPRGPWEALDAQLHALSSEHSAPPRNPYPLGIMGPYREGAIAAMVEVLVSMYCPLLPASGLGPPGEVGVLSSAHSGPSAPTVQDMAPACSAICLVSLADITFSDMPRLCLTVLSPLLDTKIRGGRPLCGAVSWCPGQDCGHAGARVWRGWGSRGVNEWMKLTLG